MPFSDFEIARYTDLIEKLVWAKRRPPLHLRDQLRDGQRISENEIELFLVRPMYSDPTRQIEESIAKARYVRTRDIWQVLWKRADLKWHRYASHPEVKTLVAFLTLVVEGKHVLLRRHHLALYRPIGLGTFATTRVFFYRPFPFSHDCLALIELTTQHVTLALKLAPQLITPSPIWRGERKTPFRHLTITTNTTLGIATGDVKLFQRRPQTTYRTRRTKRIGGDFPLGLQ